MKTQSGKATSPHLDLPRETSLVPSWAAIYLAMRIGIKSRDGPSWINNRSFSRQESKTFPDQRAEIIFADGVRTSPSTLADSKTDACEMLIVARV
jgi:hypothetical protein